MKVHEEFKTPDQLANERREALRAAFPKSAAAKDFMESLFGPVTVLRFEEGGKTHQIRNYKPESEYSAVTVTEYIEMGKKGQSEAVQTSAQKGGYGGKK